MARKRTAASPPQESQTTMAFENLDQMKIAGMNPSIFYSK